MKCSIGKHIKIKIIPNPQPKYQNMDSLHPRASSSSSSHKNFQQKNQEYIQKMSEQSKKKKANEQQNLNDSEKMYQNGFFNHISGANAPRPTRVQPSNKSQKEWTQQINIEEEIRQNIYLQQNTKPAVNQTQYQETQENTFACAQSVAQDSLRPTYENQSKTKNLLLTNYNNTQNLNGTLDGDTSYVKMEPSPNHINEQPNSAKQNNTKSSINAETSIVTMGQKSNNNVPSIVFGDSIGQSTTFQHASENFSNELQSLDRMVKENEEAINLLMGRADAVGQKIQEDDDNGEMRMVYLTADANRLSPNFIPESLFNLIDQMDNYMEAVQPEPFVNQSPKQNNNQPQEAQTNFELYEADDDIIEENTIGQNIHNQNSHNILDHITPKNQQNNSCQQPEQKQTNFQLYEEEEFIENNTFKMSKNIKPEQQDSLRNKMTITKDDIQRIISSGTSEICVIDCNEPKQSSQSSKPSILSNMQLPGNKLQNKPTTQNWLGQNDIAVQQNEAISNVIQSPPTSKRKKRVCRSTKIDSKPDEQNERAQQLMMSLTAQGIKVDQLTDRLNKLSKDQKSILLQVICQIEQGSVNSIQDVKQFIECKDNTAEQQLMQTLTKKNVQQPPQSSKRVKRVRKVVNNQISNDIE